MRVPPAAVEAFANQAIHLIPEAQTTIEKGDQRRKASGGGGGGLKSETTPINFTASQALHDLHLLMLQVLGDYDHARNLPHAYRNPLDAAKDMWAGREDIAKLDRIEAQLREGRRHLDKLAQEIDLPPDPIPLGECECGEPMVAVEGQEVIECRRCETPWEVDERRANWLNRIKETYKTPIPSTTAAALLKAFGVNVPDRTIRQWGKDKKIPRTDDGGYVLGDIAEYAGRKGLVKG